jgi:hypothetical protein
MTATATSDNKPARPAPTPWYVLGVDLGQINDPTAVAVLEHDLVRDPVYRLVHLQRFPLGTNYSEISNRIAARVNAKPLYARNSVAVDATGVGRPVVDDLKPKLKHSRFHAITITGGTTVNSAIGNINVPKRDLITTCQLLIQNHRLRIATGIPDHAALVEELLAYRITISENGHDSYGPWREHDHDDLLLALALAAWTAENRTARPATFYVTKARIPLYSQRTLDAMYPQYGWSGF